MLFIFSDQYFLPALQHNPRYKSILRDWFGTDLFGTLARYLLRPKEYLVQQAVSFYKENLQSSYSLGLQVLLLVATVVPWYYAQALRLCMHMYVYVSVCVCTCI